MIYEKRRQKLKKYAYSFCDTIRQELPKLQITKEHPTILFYRRPYSVFSDIPGSGIAEKTENGGTLIDGFYCDGRIEIYNTARERPEELRRTIRHECLHFLLDRSGHPWKDADNLFILLALEYDARPTVLYEWIKERESNPN